jgi:hypothetical protein
MREQDGCIFLAAGQKILKFAAKVGPLAALSRLGWEAQATQTIFLGSPRGNTQRAGESLHGWGLSGHLKARRNFGWVPPGRVVSRPYHMISKLKSAKMCFLMPTPGYA